MPVQYDPITNAILINGIEVGRLEIEGGKHIFTFRYEIPKEAVGTGLATWAPIRAFVAELEKIYPVIVPEIAITIETPAEDVEEFAGVTRSLDEVTIRNSGYIWRFHKSDADQWPSELHGHDYDRKLKLDGINGAIWDS